MSVPVALALLTLSMTGVGGHTTRPDEPIGTPPSNLSYNGFYTKYAQFRGLPIISSPKVRDEAFRMLIVKLGHVTARIPDKEFNLLIQAGSHYSIIASTEGQTDLPEYWSMKNDPKTDWNKRARGLGGLETSAAEENILEFPEDRYKGESIFIHEFSHTLAAYVFGKYDSKFRSDLRNAYDTAIKNGLWKNTYSASNRNEYWAEGVQMYFDCARRAVPANGVHNQVGDREELMAYDRPLYDLVDREFGHNPWRYDGRYNNNPKHNDSDDSIW